MKKILYIICSMFVLSSCNYLDIVPTGKVIPEKVTEFRALLTNGYSAFPKYKYLLSLRSDEVMPIVGDSYYTDYIDFAIWQDNSPNTTVNYPWSNPYKAIFYANSVIEDIMSAEEDTEEDSREQLKGEALLLRAYTHFDLLNLYGKPYKPESAASDRGIPIATQIDIEQKYEAATVEEVYDQIFADIKEGRELLQVEQQPQEVQYRFSKRAAIALEARVRLYHQDWEDALELAEELIPSCSLENLNEATAGDPALITSKEAIMSLEVIGSYYLNGGMHITSQLLEKYNQAGDKRFGIYFKENGNYYVCKREYGNNARITFRSGEIYLIAAEAAAHVEGKLELAKTRLKELIVNRLTPDYYAEKAVEINSMNQNQLIEEIANERARELAIEGHRWFDLRRTTRPSMEKTYVLNGEKRTATLTQDDVRYTISFPKDATDANPNLKN